MNTPNLEFTFRAPVSEETLADVRAAQELDEFGADEAVNILRDAQPDVTLLRVDER